MDTVSIFNTLKVYLKARNLTYRELAEAMKVSEAGIRRTFRDGDCSLGRLTDICRVLQIELADVLKHFPGHPKLLRRLSWEQEEELAQDKKLLLIAICCMNMWHMNDMLANLHVTRPELLILMYRLERLGFLESSAGDRYRLLVARDFSWIADGPIMRFVKSMAPDFLDHPFNADGEMLHIFNVRISRQARDVFKSRLNQIAQELADRVATDSHLPLEDRPPISICIAARAWVPEVLSGYFRDTEAFKGLLKKKENREASGAVPSSGQTRGYNPVARLTPPQNN